MPVKLRPATAELAADTVDVLVVDADASLRASLIEELETYGLVVLGAGNGVEALRLARDRTPRLILLELEMPVMNGWQFLDQRRSDRALAKIPVVLLAPSGTPAPGHFEIAGRVDLPVDKRRLVEEVERVLSGTPLPAAHRQAAPILLVVEDDDDTRNAVSELLEEHGYQVARAANGQEAEAYLRRHPGPDCIVLDLWMPVMDGWQFTNRLQELGLPTIPLVVITAAEPYWGYPVPVTQVVRKPIHPETFVAMVGRMLAGGADASSASSS